MSKRNDSITDLVEPFRSDVKEILAELEKRGSKLKIFETKRSLARQTEIFKGGFSRTMKSKHLEGKACDFVVFDKGQWSWDTKIYMSEYQMLGQIVRGYKDLKWGGDFNAVNGKKFVDLPHVEYRA